MDGSKSVSFGFSKKSENRVLKNKNEDLDDNLKEETDYVTSLEDKEVKSTKPVEKKKEYVIPLIRTNKWNSPSGTSSNDDIDTLAVQEIVKETEQKNEEWRERGMVDSKLEIPLLMQNKIPDGFETDEKLDVSLRPDEVSSETITKITSEQAFRLKPIETDYEEIPIEAFGMAMLKGMGWKPGQGIGKNNKNIAPIEATLRPKGMGLGADRKQAQAVNDTKKGNTGSKEEEETLSMKKGAFCLIEKRPHKDLYGVIQGFDEDNARLMIKLTVSGKVVTVSQYNIRLVTQKEYAKYSKYINKGAADRYKEKEEKRKEREHVEERERDKERERKREDRLRDEEEDRKQLKDKHDRKRERHAEKDRENGRSETKKRKYEDSYTNGASSHSSRDVLWVRPKLRVRIVDKKYRKGKYFNTKVEVIDVFDKDNCVCKTDEGKVLEEISQSMLETLIPKADSAYICIVNGKYKGQVAHVMERDKKNCKCLVQLLSDREKVLTLDYDSVCEYVGNVHEEFDF